MRVALPATLLTCVVPSLAWGDGPGPIPFEPLVRGGQAVAPTPLRAEPRDGCAVLLRLPSLEAVSDKGLMDHLGVYDASPVTLRLGTRALRPHVRQGACDDVFAHAPLGLLARAEPPPPTADAWSIGFVDDVVASRRKGPEGPHDIAYLLPGTHLSLSVPQGWDPEWGRARIELHGVRSRAAPGPAQLTFAGTAIPLPSGQGPFDLELVVDPPTGTSVVVLRSADDGPVVVLDRLSLGEGPGRTEVLRRTSADPVPPTPLATLPTPLDANVHRQGRPSLHPFTLPAVDEATCQALVPLPRWQDLSDLRLYEDLGLENASPLRVLAEGRPLVPHDRGIGCTGAFAHAPQGLRVRPPEVGAVSWMWTFAPEPDQTVGVRGPQGPTTITWAVPGTRTIWSWDAPSPRTVRVDLLRLGTGAGASIHAGSHATPIADHRGPQTIDIPLGAGVTAFELDVPADGPVVLVRRGLGHAVTLPIAEDRRRQARAAYAGVPGGPVTLLTSSIAVLVLAACGGSAPSGPAPDPAVAGAASSLRATASACASSPLGTVDPATVQAPGDAPAIDGPCAELMAAYTVQAGALTDSRSAHSLLGALARTADALEHAAWSGQGTDAQVASNAVRHAQTSLTALLSTLERVEDQPHQVFAAGIARADGWQRAVERDDKGLGSLRDVLERAAVSQGDDPHLVRTRGLSSALAAAQAEVAARRDALAAADLAETELAARTAYVDACAAYVTAMREVAAPWLAGEVTSEATRTPLVQRADAATTTWLAARQAELTRTAPGG